MPIYEQLYNNIVRLISVGALKPEDKIPPVRTLATQLSVNPNTVSKAYKLLESDGFIRSAVGKGSFVSPDLDSRSAEKKSALDKLDAELKSSVGKGVTRDEVMELVDRHFGGEK